MKTVSRNEIVDYQTYEDIRADFRAEVMKIKEKLRIHLGDILTFLFETRETVRYQIQEMMRAEKLVKESAIRHEIDTYNELLGEPGDLGCTLLIEIEDPELRKEKLKELIGLPESIYLILADGEKITARFDAAQVGDDRLSSVQYLRFQTDGRQVVAIGSDHPSVSLEQHFTDEQSAAIAAIEVE